MCDIKVIYYRVDSIVNIGYRIVGIITGFYEGLSVGYCSVDRRIISRPEYESRRSCIDIRCELIHFTLMCNIQIIDYRVDRSIKSRYGFVRIEAVGDLSLSRYYRSLNRRIIGSPGHKRISGVNYRLRVCVDVCLMRNVEIIVYRVYRIVESGNRLIGKAAG